MTVELIGLKKVPEIEAGADLGLVIADAALRQGVDLLEGDILVVSQKIVSKAEGRLVSLASVTPSPFAHQVGAEHRKDPRLIEVILRESKRVVRMDKGVLIVETLHGLICANAGVDVSNVSGGDVATLLPEDPDGSCRKLRDALQSELGVRLGIVMSDTFGRPWREGLVNVAIGIAGLGALHSFVAERDPHGYSLQATIAAVGDELAAAAGLVSGKLDRIPVVVVRGYAAPAGEGSMRELLRVPERDMFR